MLLTKIKTLTAVLLIVGLVASAGGLVFNHTAEAQVEAGTAKPAKHPANSGGPENKLRDIKLRQAQAEFNANDAKRIQGVWTLLSIESDGKPLPFEKGTVQLVVTNEVLIWTERGKDRAFTYKLDPRPSPRHLDLIPLLPGTEAKTAAIYLLEGEGEGERLKICESEGPRPVKFGTAARSGVTLFTYVRRESVVPEKKAPKLGKDPAPGAEINDPNAWANKLFLETVKDFGKCQSGDQLKHKFKMTNIYAVPVEMMEVRVSCGCASYSLSQQKLQPLETGYLEVTVDSRRFTGSKTVLIYVTIGPDFHSTATLTIKASN